MIDRPIKYKGWHVLQNKMYSAAEMKADGLALDPGGRHFVNVSGKDVKENEYSDERMLPLMFTGYLTEKGEEIYEDDIILAWPPVGIEGSAQRFRVVWNDILAGFAIQCPGYQFSMSVLHQKPAVSNLGSYYEHPELYDGNKPEEKKDDKNNP